MESNIQKKLFQELEIFWSPVINASGSSEHILNLFLSFGWDVASIVQSETELDNFLAQTQSLVNSLTTINNYANISPPQSIPEVIQALEDLAPIIQNVRNLRNTFSSTLPILDDLGKDILEKLFLNYLTIRFPSFYHFLEFITVIKESNPVLIIQNNAVARDTEGLPTLDLAKLSEFINNPISVLRNEYWPAGIPDEATATEVGAKIFHQIIKIFGYSGIVAFAGTSEGPKPDHIDQATWDRMQGLLTIRQKFLNLNGLFTEFGAVAGVLPATQGGPGAFIVPFSDLQFSHLFDNWQFTVNLSTGFPGIKFLQDSSLEIMDSSQANINARFAFQYVNNKEDNILKIGSVTGTRLEIEHVVLEGYVNKSSGSSDYGVILNLYNAAFVINPGDGDGFIQKAISGGEKRIDFDLGIGWSKGQGIHFQGSGGLEMQFPVKESNQDSTIKLTSLKLGIDASNTGIDIASYASGNVKIGPVTANIEQTGLAINFTFPENGGNLGPINAEIGFKPPKGVGITIDTEAVKGGGYLYFDTDKGEYAGVAQLSVKDKISLKAIGILTTKNDPASGPDYSLLLIITAEFAPVQLGMGFTLNGVGGLIGIHRTISEERLRTGVRDGSLNYILFPADPVKNAPAIIAAASQAFPVAQGRYAFGLMGKIAWGPNALITLDAGLVIEVPSPVRLAILGVLKAILPNKDKAVVQLQVNFLGFIDFDKKQIAFDASLFDSKILSYTLTGDMAFRLYSGSNPVFLISAGGFHPAFQPPVHANLPEMRRITLALANSEDFRLILSSYFALTSNTVQIGSRLDLYYKITGKYNLSGYLGFDTLFQFNPFYLDLFLEAGMEIRKRSKSILTLHLALHVTGPAPWHITGEGSFRVLGIKISFHIEKTFGNRVDTSRIDSIDVRKQLLDALAKPENWEVVQGPKPLDMVTTRKVEPAPGRLFINPSGQLVVRQKVTPLKLRLNKFGNSQPVNGSEFDINEAVFGDAPNQLQLTGEMLLDEKDFFAPSQYSELSNERKLSTPSFQQFKSGVRFKVTDEYKGGAGHAKAFNYELIILERAVSETATPDDGGGTVMMMATASAETGTMETNVVERKTATMSDAVFNALTRSSAVSKASQSQVRNAPSRLAPDAVYWDEDSYTVAYMSDMNAYGEEMQVFENQALAEDYLQRVTEQQPELVNELQVVPMYQMLELV